MEAKIGQIIKMKHQGDNGKTLRHPFVIVNITPKHIWGMQCTSVRVDDTSYFTEHDIPFFELKHSDLPHVTQVRLDSFEAIEGNRILSVEYETAENDYYELVKHLINSQWETTDLVNSNKVHEHALNGWKNFGKTLEV